MAVWAVSPWDPDFFSKLDLCEKCGAKLGYDRKAMQARCPSCGRWSFLWDADKCSQRSCGPYGVRYVWDEETRTIRCPRCGDADKVSEQMWKDLMDVKTLIYKYQCGQYIYRGLPSEEIAGLFLRVLDKDTWTFYIMHDYALAKMRFNDEMMDRLKEAVRVMALNMDYDVEDRLTLFPMMESWEDWIYLPVRIHLDIADRTFYREGWRTPDWKNWKSECLHDAYRRLNNIFDRGTPKFYAYERESNCWEMYESALRRMYDVARANGDRAACWVITRVIRNANFRIYGDPGNAGLAQLLDPFTDYFESDVESGRKRKFDMTEVTVEWYLRRAKYSLRLMPEDEMEDYGIDVKRIGKEPDLDLGSKYAMLALMTKLGYQTVPEPLLGTFNEDGWLVYPDVEEAARLAGDPELHELFVTAKKTTLWGDPPEAHEAAVELYCRVQDLVEEIPPQPRREWKVFST